MCQWAIVIAIAQLGTLEMVGQFAFAQAITIPIFMLSSLQLRQLCAIDDQHRFRLRQYAAVRVVSVALALLVATGSAFFFSRSRETFTLMVLMAFLKSAESFGELAYGVQQQQEQMKSIGVSLIIRGLLSIALTYLALRISGDLLLVVLAMLLSRATVLVFFDIPCVLSKHDLREAWRLRKEAWRHRTFSDFTPAALLPLVNLGLSLGITSFLQSLVAQAPRYAIAAFLGEHQLGVYAALAWFPVVGNLLVGAVSQSASPRLAKFHSDGNSGQFRTTFKLFLLFVWVGWSLATIAAALFGGSLLTFCYGTSLAAHHDLLTAIIALSLLFSTVEVIGVAVTSKRCVHLQPVIALVSLASTILCCWLLVPRFGIWGAVFGHASGWAVLGIGYLWLLNSHSTREYDPLWKT